MPDNSPRIAIRSERSVCSSFFHRYRNSTIAKVKNYRLFSANKNKILLKSDMSARIIEGTGQPVIKKIKPFFQAPVYPSVLPPPRNPISLNFLK
jgi:hypothetical protein